MLQFGQLWARAFTNMLRISNATCLAVAQPPIQTSVPRLIAVVKHYDHTDMERHVKCPLKARPRLDGRSSQKLGTQH